MSLAKKTVLVVIIVTLALLAVVYLVVNYVFVKSFISIENEAVQEKTNSVLVALASRQQALDSFGYDWAEWDDTYYFIQDHEEEYINLNLTDATFINSNINLMLFINSQGELVCGKLFDFNSMKEMPLPDDIDAYVDETIMSNVSGSGLGICGITRFSGQPMLTTCRIVLTSLKQGPSPGYFVAGRYIDEALTATFSDAMSYTIKWLPLPEAGQSADLESIYNTYITSGGIVIQPQSDNLISGYMVVKDITGKPAFMFKTTMARDIRDQGNKIIAYLHASLLGIALFSCVTIFIVFRWMVLARLTKLSNAVNSIGAKGEITNRVKIKGTDELARLGANINSMLDSLQKSELRRQSQKEIIGYILTNTPNGILALNEKGEVAIINDVFRNMFNLNNLVSAGSRLEDLPDMTDVSVEINNFRLSRMPSFKKEIVRLRDGISKTYIATFARLKEEELYILYLTDISEERSKQERMYLTDRLASIGEMASGIAHELNNPLTSVIGLSEIVMLDDVPENVREDMALIKSESHRAAGIVRNLLSFARKNATIKQAMNINAIIDDVLKLRSYEHGVNNIKIIKNFSADLPDIMVDHSQIQQVFINIILNAEYAMISAHSRGTLVIKTETADGMLKVSFTDDGPGIEPGNLRHIFDPFFTTKEVGKGTGLGLSISYGIVTAHNGRIYAVSEAGKGATFCIELPLNS